MSGKRQILAGVSSRPFTLLRRVLLRFAVVYLTLFCAATQISGSVTANPWFTFRGLGRLWPLREVTHWIGRTVFGIDVRLDDVSGGETLFFWVQWFSIVTASVVVTVLWTLFDRRREEGSWSPIWRVAVRVLLAGSLIEYGMTKVIPTQFPAPPLTALVTPVGEMTLSALLWTTIGSSPAYQIFSGVLEVLAGALVLIPRTVTLGALLAVVALTQVLALNMAFDIGVKLVTMHLVALAVILLAPAARNLARAFGLVEAGSRMNPNAPAIRLKADSTMALLTIALGVYLIGVQAWINWSFWQVGGGGRPQSVLYGVWSVEQLSVDGEARPAELNDYDRRWRRVIFDEPDVLVIQRTDDSFARYGASIDPSSGSIALRKGDGRTWASRLTYDRSGDDRITLTGEIDGHRIEASLQRVDSSAFPLLNSGFRWVRPHDP